MTPQQIFATALRLFALWLLVTSFKYLVTIPRYISQHADAGEMSTTLTTGALMVGLALVLWLFPLWIAHRFVPRTQFENRVNLQPLQAAQVGCALIGLWFFAQGLLSMAWNMLITAQLTAPESVYGSLAQEERARVFYAGAELVIGLLLMLRGATFARLVVREAKA